MKKVLILNLVLGLIALLDSRYLIKFTAQAEAADSKNINVVGHYATPGWAGGVHVRGNYAYIADHNAGLRVVDISEPSKPFEVGCCESATHQAFDVYVSGNYAYIADWTGDSETRSSGLWIIDVWDASNPFEVGYCNAPGIAYTIYVSGNYAYIADQRGTCAYESLPTASLWIVDVSNPYSPTVVGSCRGGGTEALYVSDGYAYIGFNGLKIIDVRDPHSPETVGWLDCGRVGGIYISGNYAYVACCGGSHCWLRVVNVSNPSNPRVEGSCIVKGTQPRGIDVSDGYAYIADHNAGLRVVDISEPSSPIEIGYFNPPGDRVTDVYISDNLIYITALRSGLWILELAPLIVSEKEPIEPIFGKHVIVKTETLPTARGGTSCCYSPLNDKIYVFAGCYGGWGARTGDLFDIVEYDPQIGSVGKMGGILPGGGDGTCCCYDSGNNKIYIFGGWNKGWENGIGLRGMGISDKIVEYDPATGSLVEKTENLPTRRFRCSCCYSPLNDKIYIFGGAYSDEFSDIIEYDPTAGSIIKKPETLPTPRSMTSCCYSPVNGKIYIFGGDHFVPFRQGHMSVPLPDIIEYDPFTGSVVKKHAVLPRGSIGSSCCYDFANHKIYIFIDRGSLRNAADIIEYDPLTDSVIGKGETLPPARGYYFQETIQKIMSETLSTKWNLTKAMESKYKKKEIGRIPTGRRLTSCCYDSSNNRIYIFGGHSFTGELPDIIEYRPVVPVMFVKNRRLGLGAVIGEPTGLSAKLWLNEKSAVDGAIAWSFVDGGLDVHADYLIHRYNILKLRKGKLPLYYGMGARVRFGDKTTVGLRSVVGLEYIFDNIPIDLFLEFAPSLNLIPDRNFGFNAVIGARYFISLPQRKRR